MKKIICAGAALVASACMVACGDSSSDGSNSSSGNIVEYKSEASLPDSCRMEVALVGDTYFACFEDKWVEVTDTATINKFKEDLDESELQEILEDLEDLMAKLSSTSGKKGKSSSSEAKDDDEVESSDSGEPESSSDEEECTSRKCKNSSSSAEGDSPSSSSEGQSEEDSSSSSGGQQGDDDANKCSGKTYDPATQYCQNGTTIADLATCGTAKYNPEEKYCTKDGEVANLATCGTARYNPATQYCQNGTTVGNLVSCGTYDPATQFCDPRAPGNIYKYVTIRLGNNGQQTWMAENLKYEPPRKVCPAGQFCRDHTLISSYCYGDDPANCTKYGRLYPWGVANGCDYNSENCDATGQGICPDGWHVPSKAELDAFTYYITENDPELAELVGCEIIDAWNGGEPYDFLSSGGEIVLLNPLPAGAALNSPSSTNGVSYSGAVGDDCSDCYTGFWSSTPDTTTSSNAYLLQIADIFRTISESTNDLGGLPVRCIKNTN